MNSLCDLLSTIGSKLQFGVRAEVQASESAYVDLVWFDKRLPLPIENKSFNMRYEPFLPVVGFEIELHTGLNDKHVKGSVSNLSNLGAQLGVIVIGKDNIIQLAKTHPKETEKQLKQTLRDRVYRWVYAEAQPKVRIVVMFEDEVLAWGKRVGIEPVKEILSASPQPISALQSVPV